MKLLNWLVSPTSQVVNSNLGNVLLVWAKYILKYVHICIYHVFEAWYINVVVNNEQKVWKQFICNLAFVTKLEYSNKI